MVKPPFWAAHVQQPLRAGQPVQIDAIWSPLHLERLARIVVVHDGIDVDRVMHTSAGDIHAEYWFPKGAPVLVNVGEMLSIVAYDQVAPAAVASKVERNALRYVAEDVRGSIEKR